MEVVWMILFLIVFIAGSYALTRFVNKKTRFGGGANMRVVDRLPVSRDKSILLIRVSDRYFLIGVANAGIHLIAELAPGEIPKSAPRDARAPLNFSQFMSKVMNQGERSAQPRQEPEGEKLNQMEELFKRHMERFSKPHDAGKGFPGDEE